MASKAIWKGTLSWGLITLPVALYSATEDRSVGFRLLHRDCRAPIAQKRVCTKCGVEVSRTAGNEVRGFELDEGNYLLMEEGDFAGLPVSSLTSIQIVEFIDPEQLDGRAPEKPYFLAVGAREKKGQKFVEPAALKAFSLLHASLESAGKLAVAKITMREKEVVCVIRPFGRVLLLQSLRWPDELRPYADIAVPLPDVTDAELNLGKQLVAAVGGDGNMVKYKDTYREALEARIKAKVEGKEVVAAAAPAEAETTQDILGSLQASLAALGGGKR